MSRSTEATQRYLAGSIRVTQGPLSLPQLTKASGVPNAGHDRSEDEPLNYGSQYGFLPELQNHLQGSYICGRDAQLASVQSTNYRALLGAPISSDSDEDLNSPRCSTSCSSEPAHSADFTDYTSTSYDDQSERSESVRGRRSCSAEPLSGQGERFQPDEDSTEPIYKLDTETQRSDAVYRNVVSSQQPHCRAGFVQDSNEQTGTEESEATATRLSVIPRWIPPKLRPKSFQPRVVRKVRMTSTEIHRSSMNYRHPRLRVELHQQQDSAGRDQQHSRTTMDITNDLLSANAQSPAQAASCNFDLTKRAGPELKQGTSLTHSASCDRTGSSTSNSAEGYTQCMSIPLICVEDSADGASAVSARGTTQAFPGCPDIQVPALATSCHNTAAWSQDAQQRDPSDRFNNPSPATRSFDEHSPYHDLQGTSNEFVNLDQPASQRSRVTLAAGDLGKISSNKTSGPCDQSPTRCESENPLQMNRRGGSSEQNVERTNRGPPMTCLDTCAHITAGNSMEQACENSSRKVGEWLCNPQYPPDGGPAATPPSDALSHFHSDDFTRYTASNSASSAEPLYRRINDFLDRHERSLQHFKGVHVFTGLTGPKIAHLFEGLSQEGTVTLARVRSLIQHALQRADLVLPYEEISYWLAGCGVELHDILDLEQTKEVLEVVHHGLEDYGCLDSDVENWIANLDPLGTAAERSVSEEGHARLYLETTLFTSSHGNRQHPQSSSDATTSKAAGPSERGELGRITRKRGADDEDHDSRGTNSPAKKVAVGSRDEPVGGKDVGKIPCVEPSCIGRDVYISDYLRKLEVHHGTYICPTCFSHFVTKRERQSHTAINSCRKHCVSPDCPDNAGKGNDAASVRSMCHEYDHTRCPNQGQREETKRNTWRLIYAIHHPSCETVPELVLQEGRERGHGSGTTATRPARATLQQLQQSLQEKETEILAMRDLLQEARDCDQVHRERAQKLQAEKKDAEQGRLKAENEAELLQRDLDKYAMLLRLARSAMTTNASSGSSFICEEISNALRSGDAKTTTSAGDFPTSDSQMDIRYNTPSSSGNARRAFNEPRRSFTTPAPQGYATPSSAATASKTFNSTLRLDSEQGARASIDDEYPFGDVMDVMTGEPVGLPEFTTYENDQMNQMGQEWQSGQT